MGHVRRELLDLAAELLDFLPQVVRDLALRDGLRHPLERARVTLLGDLGEAAEHLRVGQGLRCHRLGGVIRRPLVVAHPRPASCLGLRRCLHLGGLLLFLGDLGRLLRGLLVGRFLLGSRFGLGLCGLAVGDYLLGDFRGLDGGLLHFDQGVAPRMFLVRLAQQERGMPENGREDVIEVERHGAGQLQRAFQFLLLAGVRRRSLGVARKRRGLRQQLENEILLGILAEGTDRGHEWTDAAAFDAEFQREGGGGRTFPLHEELLGRHTILGRPNRGESGCLSFQHRTKSLGGSRSGAQDRARSVQEERRPPGIF